MVDTLEQELQEKFPHNPLQQVALEIRYPSDLTILSSILPHFQKRIRHRYPHYTSEQVVTLPAGTTSTVASFRSANGERQLKLSDQHLAIVFMHYTTFAEFEQEVLDSVNVLDELAGLATLQRVGMRYINNIDVLETDRDVADLAHPFLAIDHLPSGDLQQFVCTASLARKGYGVNITTAQLPAAGLPQRPRGAPRVRGIYVLDIDCFTDEATAVADLAEVLVLLHRETKIIFLSHVTDTYKQRMRGESDD